MTALVKVRFFYFRRVFFCVRCPEGRFLNDKGVIANNVKPLDSVSFVLYLLKRIYP